MIEFDGRGDIFQYKGDAVACPINSSGVMGNGLARAFREKIPGLYEYFLDRYPYTDDTERATQQAGYLNVFEALPKVVLFPTKVFHYHDSIVELIDHNLGILSRYHSEMGINSIALPHLGCGKGNLNFEQQVRPMIYRHFQNHALRVTILG